MRAARVVATVVRGADESWKMDHVLDADFGVGAAEFGFGSP
jgi:hypothetical protein|tara:strand:+ start:1594 stop:1716 length:123 start_codon:yes stop_codon:yes gene_type:complete